MDIKAAFRTLLKLHDAVETKPIVKSQQEKLFQILPAKNVGGPRLVVSDIIIEDGNLRNNSKRAIDKIALYGDYIDVKVVNTDDGKDLLFPVWEFSDETTLSKAVSNLLSNGFVEKKL